MEIVSEGLESTEVGAAYHSVSDTSDDTTNDELSGGLVALNSSNLDNDTDNHNNTTPHHLE